MYIYISFNGILGIMICILLPLSYKKIWKNIKKTEALILFPQKPVEGTAINFYGRITRLHNRFMLKEELYDTRWGQLQKKRNWSTKCYHMFKKSLKISKFYKHHVFKIRITWNMKRKDLQTISSDILGWTENSGCSLVCLVEQ